VRPAAKVISEADKVAPGSLNLKACAGEQEKKYIAKQPLMMPIKIKENLRSITSVLFVQ
jgi:hypothetical protein